MKELGGKTVLVTGAADGIGRAAALAFARQGSRLVLVDIDGEKLESVGRDVHNAGAEYATYVTDVSNPEEVSTMASAVRHQFGGVDVLVNVAGVCVVSDIMDMSLDDWNWILGINLLGPIHMIHEFLPEMRGRKSGHILNVASVGGLTHFGIIGAYCTTKAGLVALSKALAQEVYADGIRVTAFCPGLTQTRIMQRMRFHGYSREKLLGISDFLMGRTLSAEKTGRLIVEAVKRDREIVVTTLAGKTLVLVDRLLPGLVRFVLRHGKRLNERLYR